MVLMSVGVAVSVGRGVFEAVTEGRKVQVGRGVNVIVLVEEGVRLGAEVMVMKTWVLVAAGVAGGRVKKVNTIPKNSKTAAINRISIGIR
jgi:hypothetical protein